MGVGSGQFEGIQIRSDGHDGNELGLCRGWLQGRSHPSRLPPVPLRPIQIRIPPGERGVLLWRTRGRYLPAEIADEGYPERQRFSWMVRQRQRKASRSHFARDVACSISAQWHKGAYLAEGGQPLILVRLEDGDYRPPCFDQRGEELGGHALAVYDQPGHGRRTRRLVVAV